MPRRANGGPVESITPSHHLICLHVRVRCDPVCDKHAVALQYVVSRGLRPASYLVRRVESSANVLTVRDAASRSFSL